MFREHGVEKSAQSCGNMLMGKQEDPLLSYVREKRDRHGEKRYNSSK